MAVAVLGFCLMVKILFGLGEAGDVLWAFALLLPVVAIVVAATGALLLDPDQRPHDFAMGAVKVTVLFAALSVVVLILLMSPAFAGGD